MVLPENIVLLNIPPYCPEPNPAEKVWQWMKKNMAMKIYDNLEVLEQKIEKLIENMEGELIKPITACQFYLNAYYSIFKV